MNLTTISGKIFFVINWQNIFWEYLAKYFLNKKNTKIFSEINKGWVVGGGKRGLIQLNLAFTQLFISRMGTWQRKKAMSRFMIV